MAKVDIDNLTSLTNNELSAIDTINDNFAAIQDAIELLLSRNGASPNSMTANLDMNSNRIVNLPAAATATEPVRKSEFDDYINGVDIGNSNPVVHYSNAPSDGITDASTILNQELATGAIVVLKDKRQGSYLIKKPLLMAVPYSGLVCNGGMAKVVMDADAFNNTTYADNRSIINTGGHKYAVGLYANGSYLRVKNIELTISEWRDARYITPMWFNTSNYSVVEGCSVHDFSRAQGGIAVDDCAGIKILNNHIYNLYTKSKYESDGVTLATARSVQVTGINIDDLAVSGSLNVLVFGNTIENLTNSAEILTALGSQSDAINIQGTITKHTDRTLVIGNHIKNVGEGIDCFGRYSVIANNSFERCFGAGIKFIHGACYNTASNNTIFASGLAAFYMSGSSIPTASDVDYNTIKNNNVYGVNQSMTWYEADGTPFYTPGGAGQTFWSNVYNGGAGTATAGIRIDVISGGPFYFKNGVIEGNIIDVAGNADYGIYIEGTAGGYPIQIDRNSITGFKTADYGDTGGYGVHPPVHHTIRCGNAFSLANNTSLQPLFKAADGPTKFVVRAGRYYELRVMATVSSLPALTNSLSFALGVSGATLTVIHGQGTGQKQSGGSAAILHANWGTTGAQQITASDSATTASFEVTLSFYCAAGGTVEPQIQMNTNSAAAAVNSGTFARLTEFRTNGISYGEVA